jgi:hypothetical protein
LPIAAGEIYRTADRGAARLIQIIFWTFLPVRRVSPRPAATHKYP